MRSSKTIATAFAKLLQPKDVEDLSDAISNLDLFWKVLRYGNLLNFLENPVLTEEEKKGLTKKITAAVNLNSPSQELIDFLFSKKQIRSLPEIILSLKNLRKQIFDLEEGEITSVAPLTDEQKEQAEKILAKVSGHDVLLHEKIEPDILGGAILRIEDILIDASIRRKLRDLENVVMA